MTLQDSQFRKWTSAALLSFVTAGLLGLIMRLAFVIELPEWINYMNVKHAHSHIAMLGWIYSGLFVFIVSLFDITRNSYHRLFWWTQISILGMLITFLIQGYATFSIIFSSLHIFLSYFFIISVFRDVKSQKTLSLSSKFLFTALFFLFLSTLGIWSIAPIIKLTGGRTAWYYGAIQFFLHFQFNGWFVFAIIALILRKLEKENMPVPTSRLNSFYYLLTISCLLTYALAVTWSTPEHYIFWINSIGVAIQFVALIYMIRIIKLLAPSIRSLFSKWSFFLLKLSIWSLILKISMQTLVAVPQIATISYTVRNFVIGFIHLLMLGSLSLFLIALICNRISQSDAPGRTSILVFLFGFLVTELLLFGQGTMFWIGAGFIPYYDLLILGGSLLMVAGVMVFTYRFFFFRFR